MKDIKRMLAAVLIAAALFLFLFLFLKWDLLICILLCVGVYFGLFFLLRPVYRVGGINVETLPGGEEISSLLKEAREDLEGIETSIVEIKDERVQRDARTLYDSGKQILLYLEENPEKISLARRFFTYYLDLAALEGESKESEFTGDRPFFHPCDREAVRWLDSWGTAYTRGRVVLGTIASADRWNDCPDTIRDLEANTGALCEEMETAGAGDTAGRMGIPFAALRVISNNNRTRRPFDPETARAVQEWVVRVVKSAE